MSSAIGGYYPLELPDGEVYYPDLCALNSGRSALEFIVCELGFRALHVPFFTCEVVLEPLRRQGIEIYFYRVDENLDVADGIDVPEGAGLLYTNYFGLKDRAVGVLSSRFGKRLVVDNSQAFYSQPPSGSSSFYSPRKFFGVPDGGYASIPWLTLDTGSHERDVSHGRCSHLLKRWDLGAEDGYGDFKANDASLTGEPVRVMSRLTKRMLKGVDYGFVSRRRAANYDFLCQVLGQENTRAFERGDGVPLTYPFYDECGGLRDALTGMRIYCAQYWPNVLRDCGMDSVEYDLAQNLVHLPVDQRYGIDEMKYVAEAVQKYTGKVKKG